MAVEPTLTVELSPATGRVLNVNEFQAAAGKQITLTLTAADPDDGADAEDLVFTKAADDPGELNQGQVQGSNRVGTFTWTPAADDVQDDPHELIFTVTDADGEVTNVEVDITVEDLFETEDVPDQQVNTFQAMQELDIKPFLTYNGFASLNYKVEITNPANGVNCQGNNEANCPTINSNGIVTYTPQKDSVGAAPNNEFNVRVTATENIQGGVAATQDFSLRVNPVLTITDESFPASLRADQTQNNGVYDYTANVRFSSDSTQHLDFQFRALEVVANQPTAEDNTGKLTWTPTQADKGTKNFGLVVVDRRPGGAQQTPERVFPITVEGASLAIVSEATIGGTGQVRSNPLSDTVAERDVSAPGKVVVRNSGDIALNINTVVVAEEVEASHVPKHQGDAVNGYNLSFKDAGEKARVEALVLTPGATADIDVTARVVKDFPAIDSTTLLPAAFKIGKVTVTSVEDVNTPLVAQVTMQAENKLELDQIELCREGSDGTERCEKPDDGETVDELKPFDRLSVAVTVENKFADEDDDPVLEDVLVEVETSDSKDIDVDDDNEESDIDPDESEVFDEASIDVEDDADGTSTVKIRAFGTDENGALHGQKADIKLKVERDSHEIDISSIRLNPAVVSCDASSRNVQADVELRNIGKKKERDVKVEVRVERGNFNVFKSEKDIEMDKDDEHRSLLNFNVPTNVEPGVYAVEVKSFYKRSQVSHTETTPITVPDCGFTTGTSTTPPPATQQPAEETSEEEVEVQTGSTGNTQATGAVATATPVVTTAKKTSFGGNSTYVAALVAVIVVLLIIGGVLVALIARRP